MRGSWFHSGALHDLACVRQHYAALPSSNDPKVTAPRTGMLMIADVRIHDWKKAISLQARLFQLTKPVGPAADTFTIPEIMSPFLARAQAELGHFAAADALVARCANDNALCLRMRGHVRAAEGKWAAADCWFARAVKQSPTVPAGDAEWGEELLRKGDFDRAITHLKRAHTLGPHFADPLEMWGEALIARTAPISRWPSSRKRTNTRRTGAGCT